MSGHERVYALSTISKIMSEGCDILCLGEVCDVDVDELLPLVAGEFLVKRMIVSETGHKFHCAMLVRLGRIVVHAFSAHVSSIGSNTFKVAVQATCHVDADLNFDLLMVHWASRLYVPEGQWQRSHFGHALRGVVNQQIEAGRENLIVLGDFNDEPFSLSVNEPLLATRDPAMARRKGGMLYNPFWKHLAPIVGHTPGADEEEDFGTYYFAGNGFAKWRTLDQIMVSSSFLGSSSWHLEEAQTGVWRDGALQKHVAQRKNLIDHLPIVGFFRRH